MDAKNIWKRSYMANEIDVQPRHWNHELWRDTKIDDIHITDHIAQNIL